MAKALKVQYPRCLASEGANYDSIRTFLEDCDYHDILSPGARFRVLLIDEIDAATATAQRQLLSALDSTKQPWNAIFFFTTNTTQPKFTERFRARTQVPV